MNGPSDSSSPGTITLVNVIGASNQVTTSATSAGTAVAPYNDLVGDGVSGTDIPTGTEVTQAVNNGDGTWTFTLSNAATATPAAETLTFFANVLSPPQLNANFTIAPGTPTGSQPVQVCEATTPDNGNDWEFGVQWLAPSGSLQYVNGNSGPTEVCASTTIDVEADASTTTTTPGDSTILLGGTNTDSATVTGSDGGINPSGTVDFYACGPTASPEPCTSSSWAQFDTEALSGTSNPGSATSVQFTPSSAGDWCFAGVYSGDDTYAGSSDSTTDECFEVSPANSSTTSAPESSTGALGGPNSDIATVTGSDGSVNPTGTVTFFECGPSVSPEPCTSSSWTQFDTQMLSGTSNPGTATSATLTPNGTGYWCFASVYSGDGNYTGSSDAGTDECFDVTQGTTSTASDPTNATIDLGQADTDLATVNGNAEGGSPTGSISFYECGPTATPEPCSSQANQIGTGVNLTSEGESLAYATSRSFTPNSTGYWCFAAYYSGDSRYLASSDTTVDECVDVVQPLTITTTSPLPGGTEHVHYIVKLQASGGTAPYTWVLVSGSLPSGVTLRSSGRVTGTPRQSGTFTFTVRVKDSASPRDKVTKKLKLIISH